MGDVEHEIDTLRRALQDLEYRYDRKLADLERELDRVSDRVYDLER